MKLGRNEPCHCGSGKKYKKCCQEMDEKLEVVKVSNTKNTFDEPDIIPNWGFSEDVLKESGQEWDYPELSDDENKVIGKWWALFDDMNEPDDIQKHLKSFISGHPELVIYLSVNEEIIFDLGSAYRREGRLGDYISFLKDYKSLLPELYAEEEGIYNLDIISWLICTGNSSDINTYFSPYISNPSANADMLFDLVDLLIAKDLTTPLLELVNRTKEDVLQSDEFIAGENILIPIIYDRLSTYLKEDYTENDILGFAREYAELCSIDLTEKLIVNWTARFKDALRPFGKWEVDPTWKKQKREDFYFSISDNYMRYLHEKFGLSLISAQYHSNLIYEYGLVYLDILKRKKWNNPFDFSDEILDRSAMLIASGPFHVIDPVLAFSFLNAVYHFVDYLEVCDMLEGIHPDVVKQNTVSIYEDIFPSLGIASSVALCFETFPFWKTN